MDIIRCIIPLLLSIIEMVMNSLSGKMDFVDFQEKLAAKLQEVGREISQKVLEEMDETIRKDKKTRRGWEICRQDSKEMMTQFGMIRFRRTYYRHAQTKEHRYLLDEAVGYTSHMRIDTQVKAKVAQEAADASYRRSGESVGSRCSGETISSQTVLKTVRQFGKSVLLAKEKKVIDVLYIEADEDHVASQKGKGFEAKLVYFHEGWAGGKRRSLINPVYFSAVETATDEFWNDIWEAVDACYEIDKIRKIYVLGDGAWWIKKSFDVFPQAEFVLDRFHLMKSVKRAAGANKEQHQKLLGALRFGNFEKVQEIMVQLLEEAPTETGKKRIGEALVYLHNQWSGILKSYENKDLKCSAEGHVSHVLSERLSSRPMGWSREGADHMAQIRVCKANGMSVASEYVRQSRAKALPAISISEETVKKQRAKLAKTREILNNIPVLKWHKTYLFEALQGLSLG